MRISDWSSDVCSSDLSIERPLIMPQAILSHCRERWPQQRRVDASFAGILTASRRAALNDWLRLSGLEQLSLPGEAPGPFGRLLRKAERVLGVPFACRSEERRVGKA